MKNNRVLTIFKNGLLDENPIFRLMLGLCPTLAVTTSAANGLGMGLAATFVLVCSNIVVALLRNFIPDKVRIPAFIVVIATFVTIVQLLMEAFVSALFESLGLFIPLIVVNCIILGRAESFASKNTVFYSMMDGIAMGLGFTVALLMIASVREILGNGTIFGLSLFGASFKPVMMMILSPGGFLTLGLLLAVVNKISKKGAKAGK